MEVLLRRSTHNQCGVDGRGQDYFFSNIKNIAGVGEICVKMLVFAGQGSVGYLLRCGLVRPAQFPIRKVGSTTGGNIGRAAMERGCKKETSRSGTGAAWTQAVYLRITRRRGPCARCDVCIRWLGDTALALLGPGFGFRGGSRGLLASSLSELNANPLIMLITREIEKANKIDNLRVNSDRLLDAAQSGRWASWQRVRLRS